jgi:hypothetical protein
MRLTLPSLDIGESGARARLAFRISREDALRFRCDVRVAISLESRFTDHITPGDLFILGAPAPSRASRRLPSPFHSFLIVSLRHRSCQLQTDFLITGFDVRNVPVDPTPSDRPICRAYQFVGVIPRDEIQRRVFVLSNHKALARNLCS